MAVPVSTHAKRPARDSRRHGLDQGETTSAKDKKKKRRKDPLWAKLTVIIGALFMMAGGGSLVAVKVATAQLNEHITTASMIDTESKAFAGSNIGGAINLLLVGIDVQPSYTGPGERSGVLSDTIVIVHIPKTHDRAYLLSIPRDTRVKIPEASKYDHPGSTQKINAAFGVGYRAVEGDEKAKRSAGVDMLALTINELTGITFNGAMLIDFDGFKGVLEALGGVELCVDHRVRAIHLAYDANGKIVPVWYGEDSGIHLPKGGKELWFEEGCRHFEAALALEYSRLRKGLPRGDYDRQRHQQELIKAMVNKAMSKGIITDVPRLEKVIEAGGKAMILDTGGNKLIDFIFTLKDVAAHELVMIRTNPKEWGTKDINGISYVLLLEDSKELFRSVQTETVHSFLLSHPEFLAPS